MSFQIGETIGPYRIIGQLGQGGMATVFKAYHAALDRYVALKVLHPAFKEDQNFLSRFQREARVIARLEHPSIVPVYDFAEHNGMPFLVMKFIEGETLKARLSRGPLEPALCLRVVDAVAAGLAYAHQQGVLHRDVKPSNILLARDGQIYLADFGLARIAQAGESTLTADMMLGTPQYISPEQARGDKDLDAGTDIYSFGVVLYELMVGKVPFSADTPFSVIHDHIFSPLPLPRQRNPQVSEAVERVLLKALAKERADRYPDVASLASAFSQAYQAGIPTQVSAPAAAAAATTASSASAATVQIEAPAAAAAPFRAATPRPARRLPGWALALIIVISLACLLAGGIWLRNRRLLAQATLPPLALTQAPAAGQAPLPGESERLQALLQQVQQDPDNRDTHAKLALEYLRLDQPEPAAAELEQVIALGKDDYRFFLEISDVFASDGFWIAATRLALQGARFHPRPWPPEVTERVREYSYRAAGNPEIEPVIGPQVAPESELSGLLELSRARFQVLHGDLEKAGQVVERLLRDAPGDPLVHLLNAEMLLRRGDPRTARVVLQDLTGRQDIPDWIRRMAVELLESMPK